MTRPLSIRALILLILSYAARVPQAQTSEIYTHQALAEKIYLQLDSEVYTTDQTIWFKALIRQAVDHTPSLLSGVLYVELIAPNEKIVERKLLKIKEGIGEGYFILSPYYLPGQYLVRAYTQWNKNFDKAFFFEQYIRIFDSVVRERVEPIRHVHLLEKGEKNRHLQAILDPLALDSLHKKGLDVFITIDGKEDSLTLKRNRQKQYRLDYLIPTESQFVTLKIRSRNQDVHSKTIAVNEDYLDLQFFPESGEMVHGLMSKIGFKALDFAGKGRPVSGLIVDELGDTLTSFQSNPMGMGAFSITEIDQNKTYYAQLSPRKEASLKLLYPLPRIAEKGNILSISKRNKYLYIKASSNYLKSDSIRIRIACRGKGYYDITGRLKDGKLSSTLLSNKLPEGILAFTMIDRLGQVVAERLYFNERPETRLDIKAATDQQSYTQREKTEVNVNVTDDKGEAVSANLSLLVINKSQLGEIQFTRENILTFFLLSSDLEGEIEDPGFYFRADSSMHYHLDALMLTQGWRKYHYTKPIGEIYYQPEPFLAVSGKVSGILSKKRKKDVLLTLATFGDPQTFQTQAVDSSGRFAFALDDQYGQKLNILIQSAKKTGKKINYKIEIDEKESPPITFNHIKSLAQIDSTIKEVVAKNQERRQIQDAAVLSDSLILLDEVVVTDLRLTPSRKKVIDNYGEPDIIISGKEIQEKEESWSYGLYSVIKFNYPKLIKIWDISGFLYAEVQNSLGPTLVVIDGIPIRQYEYQYVPNIPVDNVSSFEIIKNSKAFRSHYLDVFPEVHPLDAPGFGNIIAIYTFAGKGLFGVNKTTGIFKTAVPVFAPPYEFYAPKHTNVKMDDFYTPDLRGLIHWEPNLEVNGHTNASFYNADNIGEMQIIIEAISAKGQIGYKEVSYKVKKRSF